MRLSFSQFLFLGLLGTSLLKCISAGAVVINPVVNLCQSPGMFAMTFDQGPSIYTGSALDALDSRNVKASFHPIVSFLSEASVVANLQRAAMTGHTIGLSIEASVDISKMDDEEMLSTINSRAQTIANIIGQTPTFLRIWNYKNLTTDQLNSIVKSGYVITTYNLDSYDYSKGIDVVKSYKNVLDLLSPNTKGAFISVQRDYLQGSCQSVGDIVDYVTKKGYNLVTLNECVRMTSTNGNSKNNAAVPDVPNDGADLAAVPSAPVGLPSPGNGRSQQTGAGSEQAAPHSIMALFIALTFAIGVFLY